MRKKQAALEIPAYVRETLTALETAGHQAYCVGGCVRDSLLGRMPEDWDVTTSALPEETMKVFGNRAIPTGLKHGTVTVCCQEGKVETTTFRRDGVYADHRHPEQVTFTPDLTEDLARRDFTVNAMATDLRGTVYDPFDGQADLQEGILRCVGDPERRFSEDALRILRCLRFAAVLGFSIEPETGKALLTCRNLLREMAPERVHEELTKLLCGPWAASVLRRYPDVIGAVLPEILPMVGFDQRNPHHCYDVWEHTLHALDAAPPDPVLRWTVLFHDMGKPECFALDTQGVGHFMGHGVVSRRIADGVMDRLRFDNAAKERIGELVEWHDHRVETGKGYPPDAEPLRRTEFPVPSRHPAGGQHGAGGGIPWPAEGDRPDRGHAGPGTGKGKLLFSEAAGGERKRSAGAGTVRSSGGPDAARAIGPGHGRNTAQ